MTNEEFFEFLDYCNKRLIEKQKMLLQEYKIANYQEFWWSQEGSLLQFKNNGAVLLEFSVIFIGSWSGIGNTWMWAWANESMTKEVRNQSAVLQELANVTGFDVFTTPVLECEEAIAHQITALSVEKLGAKGMYISKEDNSHMFMAIMKQNILQQ